MLSHLATSSLTILIRNKTHLFQAKSIALPDYRTPDLAIYHIFHPECYSLMNRKDSDAFPRLFRHTAECLQQRYRLLFLVSV